MRSEIVVRKRNHKIFIKAIAWSLKVLCSIAIGILTYRFFAPIAAVERGYKGAIGGEGILVLVAFYLSYILLSIMFNYASGGKRNV